MTPVTNFNTSNKMFAIIPRMATLFVFLYLPIFSYPFKSNQFVVYSIRLFLYFFNILRNLGSHFFQALNVWKVIARYCFNGRADLYPPPTTYMDYHTSLYSFRYSVGDIPVFLLNDKEK